ncbi:MAG: tetratricopeptide repeat protein [Pseudomonadota bacterium]|nr:tetratricopeptide repeat protein [Pseudomonadota bacterium]
MNVFKLVLLTLWLSGCAVAPSSLDEETSEILTPEEQFEQGEVARNKGDFPEALANYLPLTEREDDWAVRGKMAIARLSLDSGRSEAALKAYDLVLQETPTLVAAQEGRGLALLARGEWEQARRQLQIAYRNDPLRWRTLNGLGVAEDMLGNYQSAARWYGMALDAGGERPMVINNAGYSLIMAGQYREAEQLLRRAVARYPDQHRLNHNLAIAQARMGDYPQAVLTWQRSQDRAVALSNAGYIALLNGDREQARRMFEDANRSATSHRPKIAANLASVTDTSP